jgi:predicted nuclease of restriction endonuclease-like RecB superfamily
MNHASGSPFDSIESAHDFVSLFSDSVADAKREIESDIQRELTSNAPRRLDALRLAAYNLEKLELHLGQSRRILNDLRSLRRLLFEERAATRPQAGRKLTQEAAPEIHLPKPDMPPPAPAPLPAASIPQTVISVTRGAVMA